MAKPSTLKNLVLTLCVVTLCAALGLGGMYMLTKAPIEAAQAKKVQDALVAVLPTLEGGQPSFDNNPSDPEYKFSNSTDKGDIEVYPALKDGKWVATAVESFSPNGFGGRVSIMVGFNDKGEITGYSVLHQAETPGLGDKMVDWFQPPKKPVRSLVEKTFGFTMPVQEVKSNIYGLSPKSELTVSKDGGQIDAITAATISSRAFLDAVNRAYQGYLAAKEKYGKEEK